MNFCVFASQFSSLDEAKGSIVTTDRVRFRDHDDLTMRTNTTSGEKRSPTPLTQSKGKLTTDTTSNSFRRKKITKIRLKESLEILDNYYERFPRETNGEKLSF